MGFCPSVFNVSDEIFPIPLASCSHSLFYTKVWSAFQAAMFLCGAGIIAFSQIEIRLLSADAYFSAWKYIPHLSMAMVFSSFSGFLGSIYVVTLKSSLSFWTTMAGAVINVILNLILIPSAIGAHGAAAATFISFPAVFLIRIVSARRLIPFQIEPGRLFLNFALLTLQTVFLVWELPFWPFVQGAGIFLMLLFNYRPLLSGLRNNCHNGIYLRLISSCFLANACPFFFLLMTSFLLCVI